VANETSVGTSSNSHSIFDEPLADLLLCLEAREDCALIRTQCNGLEGLVQIEHGRLARAVFGTQADEIALNALLLQREGTYSVEITRPSTQNYSDLRLIGTLVRNQLRKATRSTGSGKGAALHLFSTLARTGRQLPSGLSPVALRTLANVDGHISSLKIVQSSTDPANATLHALRQMLNLGLIEDRGTVSVSPTLVMGSTPVPRRPTPTSPSNQRPSPSSERGESSPPLSPQAKSRHPSDPASMKSVGRWAKAPNKRSKLKHTGYSSVPPNALAAERVVLPTGMREPSNQRDPIDPDAHQQTGTVKTSPPPYPPVEPNRPGQFLPDLEASDESPVALRPITRKDTPTALSNASMRGARAFETINYQLRDSEIPVPSSRLDQDTLNQLDELNAALQSSRKPQIRLTDEALWPGSLRMRGLPDSRPPSEPHPPSSLGLDLPLGELPSPGSVPHPRDLPGEQPDSESPLLPRVGRYEVLARLKRGGMGSVYMCRLTGTAGFRRLFAMKVLHGHLAEQRESLVAFFHEARVLGELHHPNIVGIADVGTPHEPYIVMDYVEGGSLAELFRVTSTGRDPALVISIVLDALHGLSYAHSARDENGEPLELVHCDVTPHNLLVGIDGTCRVTDFGIARTRKELGNTSLVQGKPGYLAPERLRQHPADHRSDVFSMGVVLYIGLTGTEPFRGSTQEESFELVLRGRVQPPSEVGLRPPPALDWVCMKALASDPNARFGSAEEMAQQLHRVADRENLLTSASEVGRWVKASLGPTLAARRAASLRGTSYTDPPPPVAPAAEDRRVISDVPSSAEITGPLEPPASNAYEDRTEIIRQKQSSNRAPKSEPAGTRLHKYISYVAVAAGVGFALWAFLSPNTFSRFFKLRPDRAFDPNMAQPSAQTPTSASAAHPDPQAPSLGRQIQISEDGKVTLPPISPSGEE